MNSSAIKTTRNILCVIAALMLLNADRITAQPYATGIGIRLGTSGQGVTVKHHFDTKNALEGIVTFGRKSMLITALYERHQAFPNAEGLSWFFGGGAHVGFYNDGYDYYYYKAHGNKVYVYEDDWDKEHGFGLDFILGMEYKFKDTPIALGIDVKPFVDFVGEGYGYWDGAFTFRFTL